MFTLIVKIIYFQGIRYMIYDRKQCIRMLIIVIGYTISMSTIYNACSDLLKCSYMDEFSSLSTLISYYQLKQA